MDLVHVVRHKVLVEGRTQRAVARELAPDAREGGVVRTVGPLVDIVAVVVELFAAVGVADVSPTLRADRVVPWVVGRRCWARDTGWA